MIAVQDPVRLDEHSEPQPDVMLLRWRDDFYGGGHPGPADVLLLIEVSDTTVEYDRNAKLPLYAQAGIPDCGLSTDRPGASKPTLIHPVTSTRPSDTPALARPSLPRHSRTSFWKSTELSESSVPLARIARPLLPVLD